MDNYTKTKMHNLKIFTLAILGLLAQYLVAQKDYGIYLSAGAITIPEIDISTLAESSELSFSKFDDHYYLYLQFDDVLSDVEKNNLQSIGVMLLDYLPNYAYLAKVSTAVNWGAVPARAVVLPKPTHKMSRILLSGNFPAYTRYGDKVKILLLPYPDIPLAVCQNELSNWGYSHTEIEDGSLSLLIDADKIPALATHPALMYLDLPEAPPQAEGWVGNSAQRVNMLHAGVNNGYDGKNVNIAIADDGSVNHDDVRGRVTHYTTLDAGNHGDMTVGLTIGSGNLNPLALGVAPGALLHLYQIDNYPHLANAVQNFTQKGVVITSTSYGEGCGGFYSSDAQYVDNQTYQNKQLLHAFSAGNSGEDPCSALYGSIVGAGGIRFSNITGGRKAGKNVLTIGNVFHNDELLPSSSHGPTEDGRTKPDLCGQGQGNLTTDANNGYRLAGGTSAAAPAVAGTAALLYQAYREQNSGNNPTSDLIKAILLNTAEDIGRPGPDFEYGWGRVHAGRALQTIKNNWFQKNSLSQYTSRTHVIQVPAGVKRLRVMVYWHDPAGAILSGKALVNDLDMSLQTPTGQILRPWVLSSAPRLDSLTKNAYRGVDHLNNVEQITVDNPTQGSYSAVLNGFLVPKGPQDYVLVYYFEQEELTLTYPRGEENFVPGEVEVIRWDAIGKEGTFKLEYTTNGTTWQTIANVQGHLRYFDWTVPQAITTKARLRVSRNGKTSTTPTDFTIAYLPDFNISYLSDNQATICWQKVQAATGYTVYALGNQYMNPIGTTSDTAFVFNTSLWQSNWYSVRATFDNSKVGRRAHAKNYTHRPCEMALRLKINFDLYPGENYWRITDDAGAIWAYGGPYSDYTNGAALNVDICLPKGCYTFTMYDRYNDGMCCQNGNGSYQLLDENGKILAAGSQFGDSQSTRFCPDVPTTSLTVAIATIQHASCFGAQDGIASIQATGGTGQYNYFWSNGHTGATATHLFAGTYTVTVTDGSSQKAIALTINQPAKLTLQTAVQQTRCFNTNDGVVTAIANGGKPPYQYHWNDGFTAMVVAGLAVGSYQVTVLDSKSCEVVASVQVTSPPPISLSFAITYPEVVENGAINLTAFGGAPPYQFHWSNGATTEDIDNLAPGLYVVSVTDSKNCQVTGTAKVEEQALGTCFSRGSSTQFEWIEGVQIGTQYHQSGNNGGFGDFTALAFNLQAGNSYAFSLSPGFSITGFNEYWRIWIDLNRDGDFWDTNEAVFAPNAGSTSQVSGTFQLPADALPGTTRMRISMRYGTPPLPCNAFPYGEVEEYTVILHTANGANLAAAVGLKTSDKTDIAIFPNPASSTATVHYPAEEETPLTIEVLDVFGKVCTQLQFSATAGYNDINLPIAALPNGSYWVRISNNRVRLTKKLIISR